jgi:hypothetical protein
MVKRKRAPESTQNLLDRFPRKRGRGRPVKIVPTTVTGRARNYRDLLPRIWDELEAPLLAAKTPDDVVKAFEATLPGGNEFPPIAPLIFEVIHDSHFPKRQKARIKFFAESIAGRGLVTPRRSRDICAEERAAELEAQQAPYIIRYEYYVECSCGYKGPAENNACRKCGAKIVFPMNLGSHIGSQFF